MTVLIVDDAARAATGSRSPNVTRPKTAEEQIPLGTGTYGKF